jgi:hypothetical protein
MSQRAAFPYGMPLIAIIHVYYSPESRQEQEGDLFIHIW